MNNMRKYMSKFDSLFNNFKGTATKEAKYQLVKEVNHINSQTYYWTIDNTGALVKNTMASNFEEANRIFQIVCKNDGKTITKTVLETYCEE